jgi:hypothetical protein
MSKATCFEDLRIWQEARQLVKTISKGIGTLEAYLRK